MESFTFRHNDMEFVIINYIPCPTCGQGGRAVTDNLHGVQPDVCKICNQAAMYNYDTMTAEPMLKIKGLSNYFRNMKVAYNRACKTR